MITLFFCFVTTTFADTQITSITAEPNVVNPYEQESTTITVLGTPGVATLVVRILSSDGVSVLHEGLPVSESSEGVYMAFWDGKSTSGQLLLAGSYLLRVFNLATTTFIGSSQTILVEGLDFDAPSPFIPTGSNAITFTMNAVPGQTGLKLHFYDNWYSYWYGADGSYDLPLTETSTSGVYTATWNAVTHSQQYVNGQYQWLPTILGDRTYTIYVLDSANNQSTTTATVLINGVASITATPTQFNPSGSELTTLTANGATGLDLRMRIVEQQPDGTRITINELAMAEQQPGVYTTQWDGRKTNGELAAIGSYYLEAVHIGSNVPYSPRWTSVQVSVGTSAIASSENPFKPTGANSTVITVNAVPGQTGLKLHFYDNWYSYWYGADGSYDLPLTETSTSGVYTATWNAVTHSQQYVNGQYQWLPTILGDRTYTIYVLDSANNQSTTTGTVIITGVASVASVPADSFTPGGNNYATITAMAAPGLNLEARVINSFTNTLTNILQMVEASGSYRTEWDGRDRYGNFAGANTYRLEITQAGSTVRYYPTLNLVVNIAVFSISANPNPFVPTGENTTTITIRADALQSGLTASITHSINGTTARLPLQESGSEGTYTTQWDGRINGIIPKEGSCTIQVYDQSGNQFPATGTLTLSSAKSLTLSPNPFEATGENTATVRAEMATGLNLETRIGDIRTLPLTETNGVYSADWNGKGSTGNLVPSGTYTLTLWNSDTGIRYDLQTAIIVKIVDTLPPQTTITTGPGEETHVGTANVTFSWTGSDNLPSELHYSHRVDNGPWSDFSPATTYTIEQLSDGAHSFAVKAKDAAGNEDTSPASRNFTVDTTPPAAPSDFPAISTSTGIELTWTNSTSADVKAYNIYWNNGSGEIDYSTPYAVVLHPANHYTVAILTEGDYKFAIRAMDSAGNVQTNTNLTAAVTIAGFNLTVNLESTTYDRGQNIPISGRVALPTGDPIQNLPITLDIASNGFHRQFTAYTNPAGEYQYTFSPRSDEAGSYTVTAIAMHQGLEKKATATFDVLGLLLQPANLTLEMSTNSSKTVKFDLKNIGARQLSGLAFELIDHTPEDGITGSVDVSGLATTLGSGAAIEVPVTITASAGTPPQVAPLFSLKATAPEGSTETSVLTVKLHEATGQPFLTPDPLKMSVGRETMSTRMMTLKNDGFATMSATILRVHEPEAFPWMVIVNTDLGAIEPSAARDVQVNFNPTAGLAYGNYLIPLDLAYNGTVQTVQLTVELTAATTGKVAFTVYDDTGSLLPGTEVNLISKEMYVNSTPQGTEEYPNVIKGKTNNNGFLLLENINPGEYRYVIYAERHDPAKGEIVVEPGDTAMAKEVVMVTNLVDVKFAVSSTTINDQYSVTLNITYATDLIKPTLYAEPSSVHLSFFPEEVHEGTITITNTSNNAPVRNLTLNAAALDPGDNEVRLTFDNGSQTISLMEELGPKQTRIFGFRATIPNGPTAKLTTRSLGNILVTGEYTYSIKGEARESITTTPIPVMFTKPQDLALPAVTFVNDETDGNLNDLEYRGTTYRLPIKNNRVLPCSLGDSVKAISYIYGGPDSLSIIKQNSPYWSAVFNNGTLLQSKGDVTTFDITGLEKALETKMQLDRQIFLATPQYLGFQGSWSDREKQDTYLIPISVVTIKSAGVTVSSPVGSGGGGGWSDIPRFNEHGEVKLQIDQKISLEREAFNADLALTPSVPVLQNVDLKLNIKDKNGDDASDLFFVIVTQQTRLNSFDQGQISGPARISWQLIPSSSAGGITTEGKQYEISAAMSYDFDGKHYSYATGAETVTVKPMPKLTLDYYLPYVVMAGKPVKIKVSVANDSAGRANNLVIASGQPRIVENVNNIPVSFSINGSSALSDPTGYQASKLDIDFGELPPGGSESGYWQLTTSRDGYFVEFSADIKHENYLGVQLDPLIQAVNTHFVPAIGGKITQGSCMMAGNVTVEIHQNGLLIGADVADATTGNYFISDLTSGDYQLVIKNDTGQEISPLPITVLDGQPTEAIDITVGNEDVDSDQDGMSDCWEMYYWHNLDQKPTDDFDQDGLLNIKEYQNGADPKNPDTDGDGVLDGEDFDVTTPTRVDGIQIPSKDPTSKKLVLIIHGWMSSENEDWVQDLKMNIADKIGATEQSPSTTGLMNKETGWTVDTFNWKNMAAAPPMIDTPYTNTVIENAQKTGDVLGTMLAKANWDFIHFIAHSAGSKVAEQAALKIKEFAIPSYSVKKPRMHCSFLDSFHPGIIALYGKNMDFAEQYVNKNDLPFTSHILKFAFNFDITALGAKLFSNTHSWPYEFYNWTTNHSYNSEQFGFKLAFEYPRIKPMSHNDIIAGQLYSIGSEVEVDQDMEVGTFIINGLNTVEKSLIPSNGLESLVIDILNDIPMITSETGYVDLLDSDSLRLSTGSPVWVKFELATSDFIDTLKLNYEFLENAEGLFSIYFDDHIVFSSDQRYATSGTNHPDPIWVGNIEPGTHTIAFRLDAFTENQAVVEVNDIQLGKLKIEFIQGDNDQDGFTTLGGDCDDANYHIHPDAPELLTDGIDNNCNGEIDEDDGSMTNPVCGNGQVEDGEACDDHNLISGDGCSATCAMECVPTDEVCDGIDNDCDGQIDEEYVCAVPGDLNLDGVVDRIDIAILTSYRSRPLSECPECDFDGDGKITVLDARKLTTMCTYPNCVSN